MLLQKIWILKLDVLDPLGATLDPGKDLYFDLIKNMSKSLKVVN